MSGGDPLVVAAWGSVAEAYASSWAPRFRPFVAEALASFDPDGGPIWVPGCGPGEEAQLLAERWPDRRVIASDPAPAMVAVARAGGGRVEVFEGAADAPPKGPLAGIFSSFVLQLLPERAETLRRWASVLAPGARVGIVFWPRQAEDDAWGHLGRAMEGVGRERPDWESALRDQLPALGLRLLEARDLSHEVSYPSPAEAWRLLCEACSLQVFLRRAGASAAARCRDLWLADSGLTQRGGAWVHRPVARFWQLAPLDMHEAPGEA